MKYHYYMNGSDAMKRLKQLREEKSMSQRSLAMKLNLSQSTVSFYETGERLPDIDVLILLAKFFDVSIDYLVGYSDIRKFADSDCFTELENNIMHLVTRLDKNSQMQVEAFIKGILSRN